MDIINELQDLFGDRKFLTAMDLINLGIVKNRSTLSLWRSNKQGPSYLRLSKNKVVYPKELLVQWLQNSMCECGRGIDD